MDAAQWTGGSEEWSRRIRLNRPAESWDHALPIGNGRLGALVYGGVPEERLALNHENLWRGATRDRTTVPVHQHLPEIRRRFYEGDLLEAGRHATELLSGHQHRVQPYQPFGDLLVVFTGHEPLDGYRRELDLESGIARVEYRSAAVRYSRECFASSEHGAIVLRAVADAAGALSASICVRRLFDWHCLVQPWGEHTDALEARLGFTGQLFEGIRFAADVRICAIGGSLTVDQGSLHTEADPHGRPASADITGADEVLIILAMATDYRDPNPARACRAHLDSVPNDYTVLKDAHLSDHRAVFGRVRIDVTTPAEVQELPTNERLARMRSGLPDPGIAALFFQYGRYLLMASSRRCDQPANLQGIWNTQLRPPWDADFHHDVNLQMSYWIAEVGNLPECAEPLVDYLWRAVPEAQKAAEDLYGCGGICMPIQTDVWDRATPESPVWDVWTGAAAWLAQHLWWRWEYSGDIAVLRDRVYPFYKLVAAFYRDYLVPDPRSKSPHHGRLVTVPSQSPENPFVGGTTPVGICIGATMDFVLIREVLTRCQEASLILGCDHDERPVWEDILHRLAPYQIGRHGQLQEWLEDYEEVEPQHRHLSHLVGLYPGEQMLPDVDPLHGPAAVRALERRSERGASGWPGVWLACLWARLGNGERALELIDHVLRVAGRADDHGNYWSDSLLDCFRWGSAEPFLQTDVNYGIAAAVAELLLQSHGGILRLLPALPPRWRDGAVAGLRARGAVEVDIEWRDASLRRARIRTQLDGTCRIRPPGPSAGIRIIDAASRKELGAPDCVRDGELLVLSVRSGGEYLLQPD